MDGMEGVAFRDQQGHREGGFQGFLETPFKFKCTVTPKSVPPQKWSPGPIFAIKWSPGTILAAKIGGYFVHRTSVCFLRCSS